MYTEGNFPQIMTLYVIPFDDLAHVHSRTSAKTLMTEAGSCICTGMALHVSTKLHSVVYLWMSDYVIYSSDNIPAFNRFFQNYLDLRLKVDQCSTVKAKVTA